MYYSVTAIKETYHPNAYLQHVKNVKHGLIARTKILSILEEQPVSAGTVAAKTGMSYKVAIHHLRLLENESTITRRGNRPCIWMPTGAGQKRLVS
jgi:hypothetical protein